MNPFIVDPIQKNVLSTLLHIHQKSRGKNLFALIDTSFMPSMVPRLQEQKQQSVWCAGPLADLREIGPYLLQIETSSVAAHAQLEALCQIADGIPMLSFLLTDVSARELAQHLLPYFSWMEDGQIYTVRLADTCVTPAAIRQLDKQQNQTLAAPLHAWWVINRDGQLELLELFYGKQNTVKNSADPHINVSSEQLIRLLESTEVDEILSYLISRTPDDPIWTSLKPSAIWQICTEKMPQIHTLGISSPEAQGKHLIQAIKASTHM